MRCNDETTISCRKVVGLFYFIFFNAVSPKALGIERRCVETVLLGETLKDMLAHYSCVLNSALAGLAKNIVGALITLK